MTTAPSGTELVAFDSDGTCQATNHNNQTVRGASYTANPT